MERLFQAESPVEVLDDSVALTGGFFQALAIYDPHRTAQVFNSAGAFKDPAARLTLGRPVPSICARNSWVNGRDRRIDAILTHQQPSRQTLPNVMQTVASGKLGDLHSVHESEAAEL